MGQRAIINCMQFKAWTFYFNLMILSLKNEKKDNLPSFWCRNTVQQLFCRFCSSLFFVTVSFDEVDSGMNLPICILTASLAWFWIPFGTVVISKKLLLLLFLVSRRLKLRCTEDSQLLLTSKLVFKTNKKSPRKFKPEVRRKESHNAIGITDPAIYLDCYSSTIHPFLRALWDKIPSFSSTFVLERPHKSD